MESCEEEKSVLKRRLAASAVEVERQVILEFGERRVHVVWHNAEQAPTHPFSHVQRMKCFP